MKRSFLLIVLAVLLVGCGDEEDSTDSDRDTLTTTDTVTDTGPGRDGTSASDTTIASDLGRDAAPDSTPPTDITPDSTPPTDADTSTPQDTGQDIGPVSCATASDPLSAYSDDFEGSTLDSCWMALNQDQFTYEVANGELALTPTQNCVWYHEDEGPAFVKLITGDFMVTTTVRARQASAPDNPSPPQFQFAGLIARDPASDDTGLENYIFTVMGDRGNYLTNETKTTVNNNSTVHGPDEGRTDADADLRICRLGQMFYLYNRPIGGSEWRLETTYDRAGDPLPDTLQVGPIAYTFTNSFDLVGRFEGIDFAPVTSLADCSAP